MPWYNVAKAAILDGSLDLDTDTIKVMLVDAAETFDSDDTSLTNPAVNELSGTGYTSGFGNSGRKTLTTPAVNADQGNDRGEFDADPVTWTAIDAGTINAVILIKEVTNDADSLPIAFVDLTNTVTNGSDVTINWDAEGILHIT